jgi:ribosomal protein S18 acetylase RimI-like enzyme
MDLPVRIRPMLPSDVAGADLVAFDALQGALPLGGENFEQRARRGRSRIGHLLETDPGGAWVAESAEGRVVGLSLALLREGLWGLSLFAVEPALQGNGLGRRLLDAALDYADGSRGAIILSSADPKAMRRYARAGFALRPLVAAAGMVDRARLPAPHAGLRAGTGDDLETTEAISRAVRGATHAPDIPNALANGCDLVLLGDRGFVVHREGSPRLLAARDEEAAAALLWAALAAAPPGASVQVDFISAGQDWAIAVVLEASLALSPDGPLFVRGEVGPLRPYLPSGAYL